MKCRSSRWVLRGLVALLAIAAWLPTSAGAFCNGSFFITPHGFCSITTTQACGIPSLGDAECPAGETCMNDPRVVSFINPCSPSASPPCNAATAQARIRLDLGAGPISASPFKLTVNRVRFDLDCVGSPSLPCTDQGDIVNYLGDATITSNCTTAAGVVTWVSTTAQAGNEIVFNPTDGSGNPRPIVINANTTPGDTTGGGCSLFFNIQVVSQEPATGVQSDTTPSEIEQITGYNTVSNDATCAVNQPSGSQQTNNIEICPPCTVDECNLGCVPATGLCTAKDDSTTCGDTDGNLCTTAGCEKDAAGVGHCLQTHKVKTDCTVDQCNLGCVPATGLCTAKDDSTACGDNDNNVCTSAGCEKNAAGVGQCVQTHRGTGTCGCFTRTPGFWGTHPKITKKVLGSGLPSCGLVVNTTAAATPVSSTEDICSVGTDSKTNHTSPQQVQLIRQCMAAALNLAATAHAPQPGDCNSVFPGITQMFNTCCSGPTSVCDSGQSAAAIDASGCIGTLDRFNNLETTFDIGIGQGRADPSACQASKNNGFL